MVSKFKIKFIPKEYQLSMLMQLKNLRQNAMKMKEYAEELYRLNYRACHIEEDVEKVS